MAPAAIAFFVLLSRVSGIAKPAAFGHNGPLSGAGQIGRDGRVVYCTGLLSRSGVFLTAGSNPVLSAARQFSLFPTETSGLGKSIQVRGEAYPVNNFRDLSWGVETSQFLNVAVGHGLRGPG